MKIVTPFILMAALYLCQSSPLESDSEILGRCWHAIQVDTDNNVYELSFEAILIPGIEGGTFARSRRCPDFRLGFDQVPPDLAQTLEEISSSVPMPTRASTRGAGLRGRVRIIPLRRDNPYFISVRVVSMIELNRMTDNETREFIDELNI